VTEIITSDKKRDQQGHDHEASCIVMIVTRQALVKTTMGITFNSVEQKLLVKSTIL
jgi:hypothetical protein